MVAGAAVLLLAGTTMVLSPFGMAAGMDHGRAMLAGTTPGIEGIRSAQDRVTLDESAGGAPLAEALTTSNVRARPDPGAEVVAVLPEGRRTALLGQTMDGAWLRVSYPVDDGVQGWLPASRVALPPEVVAQLPQLDAGPPPPATPTPVGERMPDLVIAGASLLQDGRLSVEIANRGNAPLLNASIPLHVSRASGEILGVLEVGPTSLAPGGSATVVTPVVVVQTGTIQLYVDRAGEIDESNRGNNFHSILLVAGGG
jgi:hypothetical protein